MRDGIGRCRKRGDICIRKVVEVEPAIDESSRCRERTVDESAKRVRAEVQHDAEMIPLVEHHILVRFNQGASILKLVENVARRRVHTQRSKQEDAGVGIVGFHPEEGSELTGPWCSRRPGDAHVPIDGKEPLPGEAVLRDGPVPIRVGGPLH